MNERNRELLREANLEAEQANDFSLDSAERTNLYLSAARKFYTIAEYLDDQETQAALLYLSATNVQKSKYVKTVHSTGSILRVSGEIAKYPRFNGRLISSNQKYPLNNVDKIPKAVKISSPEALSDLLSLESRLAQIGLMRTGFTKDISMNDIDHTRSKLLTSTLGESFMMLSTCQQGGLMHREKLQHTVSSSRLEAASRGQNHQRAIAVGEFQTDFTDSPHSATCLSNSIKSSSVSNSDVSSYDGIRDGGSSNKGLANWWWGAVVSAVVSPASNEKSTQEKKHPDVSESFAIVKPRSVADCDSPRSSDRMRTSRFNDRAGGVVDMGASLAVLDTRASSRNSSAGLSLASSVSSADIQKMFSAPSSSHARSSAVTCSSPTSPTPLQLRRSSSSDGDELNDCEGGIESGMRGRGLNEGAAKHVAATSENTEGVVRLLQAMRRLEEENAELLRKNEYFQSLETRNKRLQKEMDAFKKDYTQRFDTIKSTLHEFAAKFPHKDNPANGFVYTGTSSHTSGENTLSDVDAAVALVATKSGSSQEGGGGGTADDTESAARSRKDEDKGSKDREKDLERVVKALLKKLDEAKAREKKKEESILKRDDMIKKYETYIRSIKEAEAKRREQVMAVGAEADGVATGAGVGVRIGGSDGPNSPKSPKSSSGAGGPLGTAGRSTQSQSGRPPLSPMPSGQGIPQPPPQRLVAGGGGVQRLSSVGSGGGSALPPRQVHPSTSTLQTSLLRSAAQQSQRPS